MKPLARRQTLRSVPARYAGPSLLAGLVLVVAACSVDVPTYRTPLVPGAPVTSTAPGFSQTYVIPYFPSSASVNRNWTQTPIVIPRTGKYRIRVQGSVSLTVNPEYPGTCSGSQDPPPAGLVGTYGPQGRRITGFRDIMRVGIFIRPLPYTDFETGFSFTAVDAQTIETETTLQGGTPLWWYYSGYITWVSCGGPVIPRYVFSGPLTLTVTEIPVEQHTLVLECNEVRGNVSVQRGANVNCAAKTEPAGGTVTDSRWTFQDAAGDGPQITGPAGQNGWSGVMVTSGTIALAAKVNGAEQSAAATVTVTPRTWPDSLPPLRTVYCPASGVTRCPLRARPRYAMDLGQTALGPGNFTLPQQVVASGPNAGWHYIPGSQGPIRFTRFVTYLHSELQNPRSRLWRGACSASQVTRWITDHENVHVRKIRASIARQRMNPELEDVVAFEAADFQRALRRADARIDRLLSDLGDGNHSDHGYPAEPCDLPVDPNP